MAYTRLRYIESTGTQYIDTGVSFNSSNYSRLRVVADTHILPHSGWAVSGIGETTGTCFYYGVNGSRTIYYASGLSDNSTGVTYTEKRAIFDLNLVAKTYHVQEVDSGNVLVDLSGISVSSPTVAAKNNFLLFAYSTSKLHPARLYSCQIYDNDTLVRDYVPMMNSNGVCGLYDEVNDVFYASASSTGFLGVREDNGLPVSGTPCVYIESDGTNYIDTGFKPNNNTKVVIDIKNETTYTQSLTVTSLFGARSASSQNVFGIWLHEKAIYPHYGNVSSEANGSLAINTLNRLTYELDKNVLRVADKSITCTPYTFTTGYNLTLLATNTAGTIDARMSTCKLYSCQIYDNGTLVRDYVPIYYNGAYGLWDKENGKFYASASSKGFSGLKADASGMPLGYEECEYIQSFGQEYIDTLFKPNQDTRVVVDSKIVSNVGDWAGYFGSRESDLSKCFSLFASGSSHANANQFYTNIGGKGDAVFISSYSTLDRHVIDSNKNVVRIDNDVVYTHTASTFQNTINAYIFAVNSGGAVDFLSSMRLYSCQIYDNDVLVRDFVPCQIGKVYGLWDRLNEAFYTTPTGAFTGKWKNDKILPISLQQFRQRMFSFIEGGLPSGYYACEYIQSDGTNYIDTTFTPNQNTRLLIDCEINTVATSGSFIACVRESANNKAFGVAMNTDYKTFFNYGNTYNRGNLNIFQQRLSVDINKNIATFTTSSSESVEISSQTFTCANTLPIFTLKEAGVINSRAYVTGKLYSYQIYDNETLIQDCVPCVNIDGIFGMYDKVNKVFYGSATASQFTGKLKDVNSYYTFPETLSLDGSALIDTGYKPNNNTKVVADFNIEAYSDQSALFGVRESGKSFLVFTNDNNNGYQVDYDGGTHTPTIDSSSGRKKVSLYEQNNGLFIESNSYSDLLDAYTETWQSTHNMYIGTINNNGSPMFDYPFRGEIYSFQIYESNVLVRDFIPAIDPMGESGLYDRVNDTFHKANMVGLPDGYAYVAGVYANGNAYIDTGIVANKGDDIVMEMDALFQSPSSWGGANWYLQYNNSTVLNKRTLVRIEFQNNVQTTYENGVLKESTDRSGSTATNQRLGIFKLGSTNAWSTAYAGQVGYMYSCKVWKDGVLVRDYIPCKNLSTGKQGLYDKVNGTFNVSVGSSNFGDANLVKYDFNYTGGVQSVALDAGTYKLQVWGADGGGYNGKGGMGGYSEGMLTLTSKTTLYIVVGGSPVDVTSGSAGTIVEGGYNGGGSAKISAYSGTYTYAQGGGGGTDIRIGTNSLYARVIVAGGGAGESNHGSIGADFSGGGMYGGGGYSNVPFGGQTPNKNTDDNSVGQYLVHGTFGQGASANPSRTNYKYVSSGGGGGWYGGGTYNLFDDNQSYYAKYCGGGSGYIYNSKTAANYPSGCLLSSKYYLTSARSVSSRGSGYGDDGTFNTGLTYVTKPVDGGGNGYARITQTA